MTNDIIAEPCDGSNGFDVEGYRSAKARKKRAVFDRDGWKCTYCGCPVIDPEAKRNKKRRATIDHIIPRGRGGTFAYENLTTACAACNAEKGCMTPDEFVGHKMRVYDWEEGRL